MVVYRKRTKTELIGAELERYVGSGNIEPENLHGEAVCAGDDSASALFPLVLPLAMDKRWSRLKQGARRSAGT